MSSEKRPSTLPASPNSSGYSAPYPRTFVFRTSPQIPHESATELMERNEEATVRLDLWIAWRNLVQRHGVEAVRVALSTELAALKGEQ